MTGVLVWKEYREQRLVWLAMAVLALGVLVLVDGPSQAPMVLTVLFCILVYTYGLVVGAILLAGEREAGTATFLRVLPASRLALWRVKAATGGALVLAQVLFLWLLLLGEEAYRRLPLEVLPVAGLAACGLVGFAWGLFFSGWARTSMGAILAALLGQVIAAPLVIGLWVLALWLVPELGSLFGEVLLVGCFGVVLGMGPLVASGIGQARLDRLRRQDPSLAPASGGGRSQIAVLLWLVFRQAGRLYCWLAVVALVAGMLLPFEVLYWPILTLLLGVVAGIVVFADEQTEGSGRFLGEQRLPPGVVWAVKAGTNLALAVAVALVLLIPVGARLALRAMHKAANEAMSPTDFELLAPFLQIGPYLSLWLIYGFSTGCLCGLLFHKPVVAGVIATGASLLLVTLWAPSLLVGGLHAWQFLGTPVVLLLTVHWLLWPWATGRLGSARAVIGLAGWLTLAGLWLAGALWYRVVEIPLVPDKLDLAGFERALEEDRRNEAGFRVREALRWVGNLRQTGEQKANQDFLNQVGNVVRGGWTDNDAELSGWLDEVFRQPWAGQLAEAARMPLGVVEDWHNQTLQSRSLDYWSAPEAVQLLIARGLQLQARGDPAAFVEHLETGLGLVRQVTHRASLLVSGADLSELFLLHGVRNWLERLGNRPDLLRRVLTLLTEHDRVYMNDSDDPLRAHYLLARNTVNHPESWASEMGTRREGERNPLAVLVVLAWEAPWEQARLQRGIRMLNNPRSPRQYLEKEFSPFFNRFAGEASLSQRNKKRYSTRLAASVAAHKLMLALRLYQAETGKLPAKLQELTPKILPSIPVDPETKEPFGYRISPGEELLVSAPGEEWLIVAPGQAILTTANRTFLVPLSAR